MVGDELLPTTIVRPVTTDRLVGYDKFDQFMVYRRQSDGSLVGCIRWDLRGKTCILCNQPWIAKSESLDDQVFSRDIEDHIHLSCQTRLRSYQGRVNLIDCLRQAGLGLSPKLTALPNQYNPDSKYATPWYCIEFAGEERIRLPRIIYGPRKNVSSISFVFLSVADHDYFIDAFKDEEVTKIGNSGTEEDSISYTIHSWTKEKTVQYFKVFAKVLEKYLPSPPVKVEDRNG